MTAAQQPSLPINVFGHPNADTTLLWHPDAGSDPDRVSALATRLARGQRVVVPTWVDGRDLLRSVRYARETCTHPPDRLRVVGYGAAGIAALTLALHQRRLGIGLREAVCVEAGPDLTDPISGQPLAEPTAPHTDTTITLVAGSDPAAAAWAEVIAAGWRTAGWPVELDL
ncbi:MAG TPA: hypothetical protein VNS81_00420 [Nocardioides sp.]|nr:hypothetical protein [Nocardioides sp.]